MRRRDRQYTTITVDIRPEVEAELARQATAHGRAIEAYAASLLEGAIHFPAFSMDRPALDRERALVAGARIRELRKGVTLGGLTIKELNRRRPSLSRFVLDNTVTMAWCFTEEATVFTETLLWRLSNLIDIAIVPPLWLYEVVNVTELAVRKGRITPERAQDFLESLADLPIEVENPTRPQMFVSVRALAGQYRLTAYDAVYLELAIRHKLPIGVG